LVVPNWNDSDEEIRDIARYLAGVSRDIPWHVTAFHPDYKMTDRAWTPVKALTRATEIGRSEGLRYVYAGNAPGRTGSSESTYCPGCATLLVERVGFRVFANHLDAGACPRCRTTIPGVWS